LYSFQGEPVKQLLLNILNKKMTNSSDLNSFVLPVHSLIKDQLAKVIGVRYEILRKEFLEQLERDKEKEIASCVLHIFAVADLQRMGDNLVITVKNTK